MSTRRVDMVLTLAQYEALASAVADHDMTLEDVGDEATRKVLNRAWQKINAAWHKDNG